MTYFPPRNPPTARKLIEELQKLDPETLVFLPGIAGDVRPVRIGERIRVQWSGFWRRNERRPEDETIAAVLLRSRD
ncbi:hypothetical protein [Microvirga sp. Mcv34]|uniref:hypothetical protein n=1 Tax=Microvirga sp. Mcv34 TaxID=2926016 RepID=UPI0021C88035|nr:hypothetical protein [Microvirga sp. Mcv34]